MLGGVDRHCPGVDLLNFVAFVAMRLVHVLHFVEGKGRKKISALVRALCEGLVLSGRSMLTFRLPYVAVPVIYPGILYQPLNWRTLGKKYKPLISIVAVECNATSGFPNNLHIVYNFYIA